MRPWSPTNCRGRAVPHRHGRGRFRRTKPVHWDLDRIFIAALIATVLFTVACFAVAWFL